MFIPTLSKFQKYAEEYSVIPLVKMVHTDLETPIRLYSRVKTEPYSVLLESVEGGIRWSRYSYIGLRPYQIVKGVGNQLTVIRGQQVESIQAHEPLQWLKQQLDEMKSPSIEGLPAFLGGVIGYIGYEMAQWLEQEKMIVKKATNHQKGYDFHLMWLDQVIVFDHLKQNLLFVKNIHVPKHVKDKELVLLYEQGMADLEAWSNELLQMSVPNEPPIVLDQAPVDFSRVKTNIPSKDFKELVEIAKEHIQNGEVYQVVLSRSFTYEPAPDPFLVYRILRVLNPSPYMYILKLDDEMVVGTSPELLVKVMDRKAYIRPIAGSRSRGNTPEEDKRLEEDLLTNEKELAEHVMLVDLARNDLGKIAQFHSVKVTEKMVVEKYSHIMHLVSQVEADLRDDVHVIDAFLSGFPAGTLSGAPKVRAMEMIAQLENEPRGVYGGAIGAFSFNGDLDSCIAIRTVYFRDGKAQVQAGAGIVYDSIPEMELKETVNKAMGMLKALQIASVEVEKVC